MLSRIAVTSVVFCLLAAALLSLKFSVNTVSALPSGFEDAAIATGVGVPTALAFLPDGKMLITTKSGQVRIYNNGLSPTAALSLGSRVCVESERGLLGIAVDPQFTTNRYVYLFYTYNRANSATNNCVQTGGNTPEGTSHPVNRVSRFTFRNDDSNTIDLSTELVLVDGMPSPAGNHNAGDLNFGKDGFLYISIGDGGCDYAGGGCAGTNDAARDLHVLTGKVLRITKTGGIPANNPFTGANTARCHETGRTTSGNTCQEIYATGLRNPFRFAFDPNAAGTRFFINDVGQNAWEEIDEGVAGADYGWNLCEGANDNPDRSGSVNCTAAPYTPPIHEYGRSIGGSITGGAFVPQGVWEPTYDDSYLFSDYVSHKIFKLTPNGTGGYTRTDFTVGADPSDSPVAMIFGPYQPPQGQATQALYYTKFNGEVRRIRYTGTANRNPVARATANPTSGAAPLDVSFNASTSSDADGDMLAFSWNFGDGSTGSGATPSHRYQTNGTYNAVVTVTDGRGGSDTATVRIDVGNTPPQPTITSPTVNQLFRVGETVTLTGSAADTQDGNLPASSLTWEVLLHHDAHTHPYRAPVSGNNIQFTTPAPEDLLAATNSFLEIRLTATDSAGLSTTISQNFQPRKVNVTFATNPTGLNLTVNGTNVTGGSTVVSWDNYQLNVNAPDQSRNGEQYAFQSWSDSGARSHTITTPATAATFTAAFRLVSATVSGTIFYAVTPSILVPNVNLNVTGPTQPAATSNSSGFYEIPGLNAGGSYTVTPSKSATSNGITALDATLVLRHVAAAGGTGQNVLNEDQQTAADASGEGGVTALDATMILRFAAARGTVSGQTGLTGTWKFNPPFLQYNGFSASAFNQNYDAFLIGDVNGTWSPTGN